MPPPRVYKTEAVVLRQARLGEADAILTLYTPFLGKLRAVAKGVHHSLRHYLFDPKAVYAGSVARFTLKTASGGRK